MSDFFFIKTKAKISKKDIYNHLSNLKTPYAAMTLLANDTTLYTNLSNDYFRRTTLSGNSYYQYTGLASGSSGAGLAFAADGTIFVSKGYNLYRFDSAGGSKTNLENLTNIANRLASNAAGDLYYFTSSTKGLYKYSLIPR